MARELDAPPRAREWRNRLPAWILDDPQWERTRPNMRHTLQIIADFCDAPDAHGHLLHAYGGRRLVAAIGCDRATFFRHVKRLQQFGFLVLLSRARNVDGRSTGNIWAIPGQRGGLDHIRTHQEGQIMVPHGTNLVPRRLQPREQLTLDARLPRSPMRPAGGAGSPDETSPADPAGPAPPSLVVTPSQIATGVVANCDGGSRKLRPYHNHGPSHGKNHGVAPRREGDGARRPRRRWVAIAVEDLREDGRLAALYARLVRDRWVDDSEASQLRVWSAAEHALRVGDTPPALFWSLVRRGLWLFISHVDEEAGQARLGRFAVDGRVSSTRSAGLADSERVASAITHMRAHGATGDVLAYMQQWGEFRTWTRVRFEAAMRTLKETADGKPADQSCPHPPADP